MFDNCWEPLCLQYFIYPALFSENISASGVPIFIWFSEISGNVWDKPLFNWVELIHQSSCCCCYGTTVQLVKSIDCLAIEFLWYCFVSSATIVSILSVFKASDFILSSYMVSMSGRLFFSFVLSMAESFYFKC